MGPSRRIRSASTVAHASGSFILHGSHSRSAHEMTAGRSTSTRSHSSSCSKRVDRPVLPPSAVRSSNSRTPTSRGRSSSSATWAGTWPVSASTELRPHSTRSQGPVASSAATTARAVASVSLPANTGSVTWIPSAQPHKIASRKIESAEFGPRVIAVQVPPVASARSQPARTPRRQ